MSSDPVRKRLAEAAADDYEMIRQVLQEGLRAEKSLWVSCPACKRRHEVRVPNQEAALKAAQLWLNQGFGNPREVPAAEGELHVERVIVAPSVSEVPGDPETG